MKLEGFIIEEIDVSNAIVLCYKNCRYAKEIYDKLEEQRFKQSLYGRTRLRFIWSPEDEYECKVVVEFFNRNKDVYVNPPRFPFPGTDMDEFQEITFMNSVNIGDCKIIYCGDVPTIRKNTEGDIFND